MKTRFTAWKLALGYLFRTGDFGTFLAFLFLWKHREHFPILEPERKVRPFVYPH
jgi:hypothetical protein